MLGGFLNFQRTTGFDYLTFSFLKILLSPVFQKKLLLRNFKIVFHILKIDKLWVMLNGSSLGPFLRENQPKYM